MAWLLKKNDSVTAVKRFFDAANSSDSVAQAFLGLTHKNGQVVAQNHVEAIRFYKLAVVAQGDKNAAVNRNNWHPRVLQKPR